MNQFPWGVAAMLFTLLSLTGYAIFLILIMDDQNSDGSV